MIYEKLFCFSNLPITSLLGLFFIIVSFLFTLLILQIRGIKNLIFYSLPERKEFYPEVIFDNHIRINRTLICHTSIIIRIQNDVCSSFSGLKYDRWS